MDQAIKSVPTAFAPNISFKKSPLRPSRVLEENPEHEAYKATKNDDAQKVATSEDNTLLFQPDEQTTSSNKAAVTHEKRAAGYAPIDNISAETQPRLPVYCQGKDSVFQ